MVFSLMQYDLSRNCFKSRKVFPFMIRYIAKHGYNNFDRFFQNSHSLKPVVEVSESSENVKSKTLLHVIEYIKDSRIKYNCLIHSHKLPVPYFKQKLYRKKIINQRRVAEYMNSTPLIIEKICGLRKDAKEVENLKLQYNHKENLIENSETQSFPFSKFEKFDESAVSIKQFEGQNYPYLNKPNQSIKEDIQLRLKAYNENKSNNFKLSQVTKKNDDEELGFRIYKDTLVADLNENCLEEPYYYGTPKPNIPKSNVPCGGCGINLHCQDEGLPGYVPSEDFCGKSKDELRTLLCQRCYFLIQHKMALNVRVSPEIYEKALEPIGASKSLILVIIDILDAPCSIWPGLFNLIGSRRPVIVIGNKVDLIPLDNMHYMSSIKAALLDSIQGTNLWKTNIKDVCLVSAKTGFGIEDLISNIQVNWGVQGDIYIIGCTNAGKSSLFNALLGSDLCKIAASNLIRRATSSPWPGTTLNLLKFPIMRPTGKRIFDRTRRLQEQKRKNKEEKQTIKLPLQQKKFIASLTGHIGQTYRIPIKEDNYTDPFNVNIAKLPKDPTVGIDDQKYEFRDSRWCYDTPGTVQPDQFLGLLTHEELVDVLPKEMIVPRTFAMKSSQSLFIGGLVRIDLLFSESLIRMTVCSSSPIPITIVPTSEASDIHRTYLGTTLLHVPRGSKERLKHWPALKPANIWIKGKGAETAADVVLSSAGFIAICGEEGSNIDLRGWTPGGRGVHVRTVSILPHAEKLRGKRRRGSLRYDSRVFNLE